MHSQTHTLSSILGDALTQTFTIYVFVYFFETQFYFWLVCFAWLGLALAVKAAAGSNYDGLGRFIIGKKDSSF